MRKHLDEQIVNYGQQVVVNLVSVTVHCWGSALGPYQLSLGSLRTKLRSSVTSICGPGVVYIPSQVDQKGSEKKLGEVFRSTITSLGSCLVKYVEM